MATRTTNKFVLQNFLEKAQKGKEVKSDEQFAPILLDEVVINRPLSEFGKTRKEIIKNNTWEDFANKRYLGNFEKNMGQTIDNLPKYRKQEYEDYINKLAFNEYVKTHPTFKNEKRGEYIDRIQNENVNSSNFEKAYEANAEYNPSTDINLWRKSLMGLGSLILGPQTINRLKQSSDYFSAKEKQHINEHPVASAFDTVLGTIAPLEIPANMAYGENNTWDEALSGRPSDVPIEARLLGDPTMLAFEAAPLISKGVGIAGKTLGTEEGLLSNAYKLNVNAERLNDANKSYRVAGINALEDFQNTGVLRSKLPELSENATLFERAAARPTSFPSFQKGYADMAYAKPEGSVVFETALPTFKRGEINPVTGFPIKGRHYAHRVINPETGAAMAEIPAADIRVFGDKPHWWKGYQELEIPAASVESAPLSVNTVENVVPNISESVSSAPWQMQDLPGLHLQSTMDNGAISKIVEPKSGLINTEQALAIIGKESGGADKVAEIRKGLGEKLPKKMDYNEFRKAVQDKLIPLDVQINPFANSSYGVSSIGYDAKNRDMKLIQKELQDFISGKNTDISSLSKGTRGVITGEGNISIIDANTFSKTGIPEFLPLDAVLNKVKSNDILLDIAYNKKYINSTPLENKTITFSNKSKFGKGSSAHNNPDETLGHAHYLIDAETPNIINLTQLQSDAFQGTHRVMPKTSSSTFDRLNYSLQRQLEIQERNKSVLNKMITEGVDESGRPVLDYEIKQMQEIVDAQELQNVLQKGHVENFTQKSLLDKDHQSRFLQEFVNYAGKKGNINKVRVPTSETAANVQNYMSISNNTIGPNTKKLLDDSSSFDEFIKLKYDEVGGYDFNNEELKSLEKIFNDYKSNTLKPTYEPQHQTILKKYSEQPKLIKKLFGQDAKIVTDSKGNTWYEFDIPKNFKEGKGQIKAFAEGGSVNLKQKDIDGYHFRKKILREEIELGNMSAESAHEDWSNHINNLKSKYQNDNGEDLYLPHEEMHHFNPTPPVNEEQQEEEYYTDNQLSEQEQGGMLYADRNRDYSHEQTMNKYMFPEQTLMKFMKGNQKQNGGLIPFHTYYQQTIINSRNKS